MRAIASTDDPRQAGKDTMKVTRRAFLRTVPVAAVALTLPLAPTSGQASGLSGDRFSVGDVRQPAAELVRPAGDPPFEPFWVKTFLSTKSWPNPEVIDEPTGSVAVGRMLRVEEPQQGHRLLVWDARQNERFHVGAEAVGPIDPPFWADYSDDGRWMDVTLTPLQHIKAMQGDLEVFRDLVTAGLQGETKPGFYRILRRVYNETMDSRTMPDIRDRYLLKDVLYTQYFAGNGSAIHYNWWGPPRGFGYPGSHGCLGMRLAGSKFLWDWADVGTALTVHY
jgi:hypothetical protein